MERFQRHLTTAAFKLAGGVDVSSSIPFRPVKQNPIPQVFITRITKGFLDALYAFLDGLVLLASDESPIVTGDILAKMESSGTNHLDLFDLSDGVSSPFLLWYLDDSIWNPFILFYTPLRTLGYTPVTSDIALWISGRCFDPEHVRPVGGRLWHFIDARQTGE